MGVGQPPNVILLNLPLKSQLVVILLPLKTTEKKWQRAITSVSQMLLEISTLDSSKNLQVDLRKGEHKNQTLDPAI